MYTEEYEKRGFPIYFLVKIIIVGLFVVGVVWFITKFISNGENRSGIYKNTSNVEALSSQIFINNLERMKNAAIDYYDDNRLPKEDKDFSTITLKEMIDKKLIITLIDKNNKPCDIEKSYASVTREEGIYILKVNLKDSEKEDYILIDLK